MKILFVGNLKTVNKLGLALKTLIRILFLFFLIFLLIRLATL